MHLGIQLDSDQSGSQSVQLSMALLEEIELICAILQQLFEHADHWYDLDFQTYQDLKDYCLFSVPKLLLRCNTATIQPASVTEHHLAKITQSVIEHNHDEARRRLAMDMNAV